MASYTKSALEAMTADALREICKKEGITGVSKKRKDIIIDLLMEASISTPAASTSSSSAPSAPKAAITNGVDCTITKHGTNQAKIHISCGANSSKYDVAGKTVAQVEALLKDIMNVPSLASSIVNGTSVTGNYVLQSGDALEFIKPAGTKGC